MIGIICALPEEKKAFGSALKLDNPYTIGGLDFFPGKLSGVPITLVESGIGIVNATMAATILCNAFDVKQIVLSGIAGGIDPALQVGDIVIGTRHIKIDYGRYQKGEITLFQPGDRPLGQPSGTIGYPLAPVLTNLLQKTLADLQLPTWEDRVASINYGTIITSDVFLNDSQRREVLHAAHQALAIEMEGAAIAQVTAAFGVGFINIRALSDLAGDEGHLDFSKFGPHVAQAAALIVEQVVRALAEETAAFRPQPPII